MPTANELPRIEPYDEHDLKEECDQCHGHRIVPSEKVVLKKPCKMCGGDGRRYWVDKIMRKSSPTEKDIMFRCAQDNIHFLIEAIREQGRMIGIDVLVDIRYQQYSYNSHEHTSMTKVKFLEETIKGGKF